MISILFHPFTYEELLEQKVRAELCRKQNNPTYTAYPSSVIVPKKGRIVSETIPSFVVHPKRAELFPQRINFLHDGMTCPASASRR